MSVLDGQKERVKDLLGFNKRYFSESLNKNNKFNSYLAGLFEGDGHI
ncbi:MAG: hypothetical protein O7D30_09015 [Rickettsia endosymbiont of Ixodes persulcatus]|nr:hypothetical protein [Rickettsia endosymbiont of Ixodes persulcatus]